MDELKAETSVRSRDAVHAHVDVRHAPQGMITGRSRQCSVCVTNVSPSTFWQRNLELTALTLNKGRERPDMSSSRQCPTTGLFKSRVSRMPISRGDGAVYVLTTSGDDELGVYLELSRVNPRATPPSQEYLWWSKYPLFAGL